MKKSHLTLIILAIFFTVLGCSQEKEKFNETAMQFWIICDTLTMYEIENSNLPQSRQELISFLESHTKGDKEFKKWLIGIKNAELEINNLEKLKPNDPYITFRAKGEKKTYILLKNRTMKTKD